MTTRDFIQQLKQYVPAKTEAGEFEKNLVIGAARCIVEKFEELEGSEYDADNHEKIVGAINEGKEAANDLIRHLSGYGQSKDKIMSLVDIIEINFDKVTDWIYNKNH